MSDSVNDFDWKNPDEDKEYFDKMGMELKFECYSEKKPDACHQLAHFLDIFKKDPEKARTVYEKNCTDHKFPQSCYKLGNYKLMGTGGPKDIEGALQSYISGCDNGFAPSCDNAGTLLMDEKRLGRHNTDLALSYFDKACNMKDVKSCRKLMGFYIKGVPRVPKDMKKAFVYATKGCELGNYRACGNLSVMYRNGEGVEADPRLEEKYIQKAKDIHKEMMASRLGLGK